MKDLESVLLIPVPQSESLVGSLRAEFDPGARKGIPAHITLLFPFAPPDDIGAHTVATLGEIFAPVKCFSFTLTEVKRFLQGVVWLEPEPSAPFIDLTNLVAKAFPSYPPWAGEHAQIIPHLTVGHSMHDSDLLRMEQATRVHLPIDATAERIDLLVETPEGPWKILRSFELG